MTDVHSSKTRSYNMSRVRSKNTKPELIVRRGLFANGIRYRLHDARLPGKPDLILSKYKTIIFIHGCFWHGHKDCRYAALPNQNHQFWSEKINSNTVRDQRQQKELIEAGWRVIVVWGCELKPKRQEATIQKIIESLQEKPF